MRHYIYKYQATLVTGYGLLDHIFVTVAYINPKLLVLYGINEHGIVNGLRIVLTWAKLFGLISSFTRVLWQVQISVLKYKLHIYIHTINSKNLLLTCCSRLDTPLREKSLLITWKHLSYFNYCSPPLVYVFYPSKEIDKVTKAF